MKSKTLTCMLAITLLGVLAGPLRVAAQDGQANYFFVRLSSLGGSSSSPNSINDLGWVTGTSNLKGNVDENAVLWLGGSRTNLGTLGGPNSAVLWPVHNDRGLIVGVSDTSIRDLYGETWSCGAFFPPSHTGYTCQGFLWQNREMTALPTLGGSNGFATGANNSGEMVGWAETTVQDTTCISPQIFQFLPVVYGPKVNEIAPLAPYPGDPDGAATAINDKGEIVGISGTCGIAVGGPSAYHAVVWQNGVPTALSTLGGVENNTPMEINNVGQIVGFSDLPGDQSGFNAVLWEADGNIQNLGLLPGDFFSEATGINDKGQIVGESCNASFTLCTAVIWQNGVMTDLNALIPHGSLYLFFANDINASGEITGVALNEKTGELVGYMAIPTTGRAGEASRARVVPRVPVPEGVTVQLERKFGLGHFGAGLTNQ